MADFRSAFIQGNAPIKQAMLILQNTNFGICLVVDENEVLRGVITDGDIRRGLLNSVALTEECSRIMSKTPLTMAPGTTRIAALKQMEKAAVQQIPLVDSEKRVRGLLMLKELMKHEEHKNIVFINAGGVGKRLLPLTENCPKPLLTIGDKPILENIIENFQKCGFREFYISVNYMADMVKDQIGDGRRWGVNITYVTETKSLGTAGSISVLKGRTDLPVLVSNGDLLTSVDYEGLLNYHVKSKAAATMCVREHEFQVPYGVVEIEDGKMSTLEEKPIHKFYINAGIYVLGTEALELLQAEEPMDMPDVLNQLKSRHPKLGIATFPIHEYWLDIGQMEDFRRAQNDIGQIAVRRPHGKA